MLLCCTWTSNIISAKGSTTQPQPVSPATSDVITTLACSKDDTMLNIKRRLSNGCFAGFPVKQLNVFYVSPLPVHYL
jgi:hypothetical protein